MRDLPSEARHPVVRLNTVAAMLTLISAGVAVRFIFAPGNDLAALAGAILVVSGPTVVGPLLDIVRPREPVGSILRWEGTMLDPIGATMGVIALNVVLANGSLAGSTRCCRWLPGWVSGCWWGWWPAHSWCS
ncbi:MAG: hypothetical protein R2789_11245 [Microthrixaceae bacterium]